MSKSLKNDRTFNDEYDYEYEDNNINSVVRKIMNAARIAIRKTWN